jgi:phosphoenolpyruvate carboxykinase (GTP)
MSMPYEVKHAKLKQWVREAAELCQPDEVYWCDGSQEEYDRLMVHMVANGSTTQLFPVPL